MFYFKISRSLQSSTSCLFASDFKENNGPSLARFIMWVSPAER